MIQLYTGNGKGKTTAAWGQALRGIGRGLRVAVVRFLKPDPSGETIAARALEPQILVFGKSSPFDPALNQRENLVLKSESRQNFKEAVALIQSGEFDMVVLDEICIVLHYGFVSTRELLDVLEARPPHVEIILTGRYAPAEIIEAADLVTEMVEVKHPGGTRLGIEL